ncbi:N-acetylmuramoyl-L-alanine amidase [Paenibacillus sp. GCM10012307]|uniref:N-acetylmuramoyl-L-alanine amidase n=2 Tax=Paenibacillus roseus TaxID=2798579 RepID=A0A934JBJ9_9BACL|nr:N-acetylmuramoyl-L-alanine amidase [Paenibacillus roseus]
MTCTYVTNHIPKSTPANRRPGLVMQPNTITIHNTGNASSTATNERAWLTNPANSRTASYHIVIDEREAIECLPLDEAAWHAGDGSGGKSGNRTSIGIEICESGNYAKTLDNAAELVARLLKERGWGITQLRRHFDWSGKVCPRLMYDGGKWTGWAAFKEAVEAKMKPKEEPKVNEKNGRLEAIVKVNGKELAEKGYVEKGVTYVPVRAVAEALGAKVTWDGGTKTVEITVK